MKIASIIANSNANISEFDEREETENGNTLLHVECALTNKIESNIDIIDNKARNMNGWTPLFSAAYANNQEAKNILLHNSFHADSFDYFGNSATFYLKK